jgi:hypothetical protein
MDADQRSRPVPRALGALIQGAVDALRRKADSKPNDAMLFLGNGHQAFPSLVVLDPILEPVDKVVWMVIRQHAGETGRSTAFPSYTEILKGANISSHSTVARSLGILRAARWLTLCARVRGDGGRFRGNVYALHDEPLPLADTVQLDPHYMGFLQEARTHRHRRVRAVAAGVLDSIDQDIAAGVDLAVPESPVARRLEALDTLGEHGGNRYFSFSAEVVARLRNGQSAGPDPDRLQISKTAGDRLRNSKTVCSSSYINTTTTENTGRSTQKSKTVPKEPALCYPSRLSENERALAERYLARLPENRRQQVLDELEGRIRAERKGADPVISEVQYLAHLCRCVENGTFQFALGLKVQDERDQRRREAQQRQRDQLAQAEARKRRASSREGQANPLAEVKRRLGLRSAPAPESPER